MGATGSAVVDFGAFPGKESTSVVIIGQAGIVATSLVEAWVAANQTSPASDHGSDDIRVDPIFVYAGTIVAATGFTIFAEADNINGFAGGLRIGKYNISWIWQ